MSVPSWSWVLLTSVVLAGCHLPPEPPVTPLSATAPASILSIDECMSLPGYSDFRSRLEQVTAAKDGAALRALFHPDGAMRVNGIGGHATTPDWGFDRPHAQSVWSELDQILSLGCVQRGERLLLPAMAGLAEDEAVSTEQDVALERFALRSRPDPASPVVRWIDTGEVVTLISGGDGWARLQVGDAEGYGPSESLRSPHGFQLVLVPFEGSWRIREFSDGV